MVKTITKIGNSHGIIFDTTLLDLTHLKPGDQVSITIHDGGAITLTPLRPQIKREDLSTMIDEVFTDYDETLKKLA